MSDDLLKLTWSKGPAIPNNLFPNVCDNIEDIEVEYDCNTKMEEENMDY